MLHPDPYPVPKFSWIGNTATLGQEITKKTKIIAEGGFKINDDYQDQLKKY